MNLLFVCHHPSTNTAQLRDAATSGIASLDLAGITVETRTPVQCDAELVKASDGILIGTTENFGGMAGLTKDFFERIYYPCLENTRGLPVAVYIRAGQDGQGTKIQIERILKGLGWRLIDDPRILHGQWDEAYKRQVGELAMTLAAGLDAGVY